MLKNGNQEIQLSATVTPVTLTADAVGGDSGTVTVTFGAAAARGLVNSPRDM
jgi:hypothetical protein